MRTPAVGMPAAFSEVHDDLRAARRRALVELVSASSFSSISAVKLSLFRVHERGRCSSAARRASLATGSASGRAPTATRRRP